MRGLTAWWTRAGDSQNRGGGVQRRSQLGEQRGESLTSSSCVSIEIWRWGQNYIIAAATPCFSRPTNARFFVHLTPERGHPSKAGSCGREPWSAKAAPLPPCDTLIFSQPGIGPKRARKKTSACAVSTLLRTRGSDGVPKARVLDPTTGWACKRRTIEFFGSQRVLHRFVKRYRRVTNTAEVLNRCRFTRTLADAWVLCKHCFL